MKRRLAGAFYEFRRIVALISDALPGFKPWLLRRYFQARDLHKSFRLHLAKNRPPITRDELIRQLRELGPEAGDVVMLHSSLSAMGFIEGGADTVIDAVLDVLGPQGTLLVPAYSLADWSLENLRNLPVLEPDAPSQMGIISSRLMKWEGVVRSYHPTHRWVGVGPHAEYLLKDHHRSVTPCGHDSPFDRILELDGWVLTLGSPWGRCTFWHVIEDRVDFPLDVYYPEDFQGPVRFPDGIVRRVPFRIHDPVLGRVRIDQRRDHEWMILERFRRYGLVREGKIGAGKGVAVRARDFFKGLENLLEEGITIYKGKP